MKRLILLLCATILLVPTIFAQGSMDTPGNFEVVGSRAVWDAVDGAESYTLRWQRSIIDTEWTERNVSVRQTNYDLGALSLDTLYTFQVKAISSIDGDSAWSIIESKLPVPPLPVEAPVLQRVDTGIQWAEIAGADGYSVEWLGCEGLVYSRFVHEHPRANLPRTRTHIRHLLQVKATSDAAGYETVSRWSDLLVLCADDLIPPPTPMPSPTEAATETPAATATVAPVLPPPRDTTPDPLDPMEPGEDCWWTGHRMFRRIESISEVSADNCVKSIDETITREKWCEYWNVPPSMPVLLKGSFQPERVSVLCDLLTPANLKVVGDVAIWDAATDAEGYELRWREKPAESESTPTPIPDEGWTEQYVSAFETKYRLDALTRNVAYELQIRALGFPGSVQDDSDWSETVSFTLPLRKLSAPTGLRYDAATGNVGWHPVGGATGYTLRVFQCFAPTNEIAVTGTSHALDDPDKHIGYVGQVRTVRHGTVYEAASAWSDPLLLCVAPPPTATPTVTATPTATVTDTPAPTNTSRPRATRTPKPKKRTPTPNCPREESEFAARHHTYAPGKCRIYNYRRTWTITCHGRSASDWSRTRTDQVDCPGKNPGDSDDSGPPPYSDLSGS